MKVMLGILRDEHCLVRKLNLTKPKIKRQPCRLFFFAPLSKPAIENKEQMFYPDDNPYGKKIGGSSIQKIEIMTPFS
ncbi:hypothetical protein LRR81_03010 [Metabacillus sp. GX 13764]|uniref:hypothetical protein n=1 Tax=Metabacillus kandeliae TaxID=2900151 RepID=UPI001E43109A|nr:hypothetical protein [Metabacillus kandeliae]MCD7033185.1 hypothetical protein [Metabacillus kandeliae]